MKLQFKSQNSGFTLVELLVVISIIAVLAGVSMPVYNKVTMQGKMTASMQQSHGIFLGLKGYAGDHDGSFPEAEESANEAYRRLLPRYIEKEDAFFVAGSPWHNSAKAKRPDNDIGSKPDYANCLEQGENHFAYVTGLNDSSPSDLPIIADGFSETVGQYTDKKDKKGGVWAGEKAIIVYCDGQKKMELIDDRTLRVLKKKGGGQDVDIFSQDYGTDPSNVKNPQ